MNIKNFSFTYSGAKNPSIKKINLPIYKNKVTTIIGPSGCGKSTLLRSLNRIHDLYPGSKYEGEILLNNENILNYKTEDELIKLRQRVGMIFQKPTPFPMSIFENIAYGLRLGGKYDKEKIKNKVLKALKDVGLLDEVKNKLHEDARNLSGGQQQRLCIARAIALNPEILLMDEPTSSLDPVVTKKIEDLIKKLKDKITIVLVTHDMNQAKRISDNIAFMYNGNLIEFNESGDFFTNPTKKITKDYINGKID